MKLFKSLLVSLSILMFAQVPSAQAMEFGVETLPYVVQDIGEQISGYIIPGIAIATLTGTAYFMHQLSTGIDRALNNFKKNNRNLIISMAMVSKK